MPKHHPYSGAAPAARRQVESRLVPVSSIAPCLWSASRWGPCLSVGHKRKLTDPNITPGMACGVGQLHGPDCWKQGRNLVHIVKPNPPEQNPRRLTASPSLQVAIAMACALVVAQVVDWVTATHVLLGVLTLFTSVNRAAALPNRRCARCGHRQ